jgi:hypothetical protein
MNPIEHKIYQSEIKESDPTELSITHFISTEKRDRGNDILMATKNEKGRGMVLEGRVVVLFNHGWSNIGMEAIAKPAWIKPGEFKGNKGIMAKTVFYDDKAGRGRELWDKASKGFLVNWSVGWRPLIWDIRKETDGSETRVVYEWDCVEYSLLGGVPMNPDAQNINAMTDGLSFKFLPCICGTPCKEGEACQYEKYGDIIAWKNQDGAWEEKPYPSEHSCRLESPEKFIRIRRQNDKFGKGIHAIWGVQGGGKPVELQAIRFSKDKFTTKEARAWLKNHDYKCMMFEPASEKCEKCGKLMLIKWDQDVSGEKCGLTCEAEFSYVHDGECKDGDGVEKKGAIPYKKTPLAPEGEKWNAGAEVRKADTAALKIMCAWYDSDNPDVKGSYKLPHHKGDGEHACVWNGVRGAAAVIMGARGGADIPAGDLGRVRAHIAGHYKDFDKGDPPWKGKDGEAFLEATEILFRGGKEKMDDPKVREAFGKSIHGLSLHFLPDLAEFFAPEMKQTEDEWAPDPCSDEDVSFMMVDADKVREENGTEDFAHGGHHYTFDFIPEPEIWVDQRMTDEDIMQAKTSLFSERQCMKYCGTDCQVGGETGSIGGKVMRHMMDPNADNGGNHDEQDHHWYEHGGNHFHARGMTYRYNPGSGLYETHAMPNGETIPKDKAEFFAKDVDEAVKSVIAKYAPGKPGPDAEGKDGKLCGDPPEHFVLKCKVCGKVMDSCRCDAEDKTVKFDVCEDCKRKESEPTQIAVINSVEDEKKALAEMSRQLSKQLTDFGKGFTDDMRALVRAEIRKVTGKVD